MIIVIYYYVRFIISIINDHAEWVTLNTALLFLGIQIGISTLQDTTKTQNKFSRKIWEHPKKGKITLLLMSFMVVFFLIMGIVGYFKSTENIHKEISFGLIVLGIGLIGMLKSAIEMFENHRQDKNN